MIPEPIYPEYRLTLVWRRDEDGMGVRAYLVAVEPDKPDQPLIAHWHPSLNVLEAVEFILTEFFKK
jgi:hypothetical protein